MSCMPSWAFRKRVSVKIVVDGQLEDEYLAMLMEVLDISEGQCYVSQETSN
jgi:hypothetical protein